MKKRQVAQLKDYRKDPNVTAMTSLGNLKSSSGLPLELLLGARQCWLSCGCDGRFNAHDKPHVPSCHHEPRPDGT